MAMQSNRRVIPIVVDECEVPLLLSGRHFIKYSGDAEQLRIALQELGLVDGNETPLVRDKPEAIRTLRRIIADRFGWMEIVAKGKREAIGDAYVEVWLAPGLRPSRIGLGAITPSRLFDDIRATDENVLIAGHPGTGKTSTLHFLLYRWSQAERVDIPIFARLKRFNHRLGGTFEDFLREQLYTGLPLPLRKILESFDLFPDLDTILLLDGLDEVPIGGYEKLHEQLGQHLQQYPRSRAILTTRLEGFRDVRENDFLQWRPWSIAALSDEQIAKFVEHAIPKEEDRENFLKRLEEPRLRDLAGRAFLLTLMTTVFNEGHDLGPNRSALYEQATSYLERSRSVAVPEADREKRHLILRETALRFLQLDAKELDEGIIAAHIEGSRVMKVPEPVAFLERTAKDTGILQRHGGSYSFTHKSFQEYYAALALGDMISGRDLLLAYCTVPQWEETVRLYAGSLHRGAAQQDFVSELWIRNPALALRTATECHQLGPAFLRGLIRESEPESRVRMLDAVRRSLGEMEAGQATRTVIETLAPLFDCEHDAAVMYFALRLIDEFDPSDSGELRQRNFLLGAPALHQELSSDPAYRWEMVEIPSGSFYMGDDAAQDDMERPAHLVSVGAAFQMGRYQITNLAWERIMGSDASKRNEYSKGDNDPVVNVSWFEAFICAFRAGARLPSEAEWEYAARAGSTGQYCYGDEVNRLKEFANFEESGFHKTWEVGSGKPNNWGLYDVHGNVWEWCQDWLAPYSPAAQVNPRGPAVGTMRVRRGGGHAYHARGCRAAFRWGNDPYYRFRDIGFRVARDSEPVGTEDLESP